MIEMCFADIDRINNILSDLLSFSRLGSIQKTDIYIDDVVHDASVTVKLPENIEIKKI
jgi:signal transduction histidine kinase